MKIMKIKKRIKKDFLILKINKINILYIYIIELIISKIIIFIFIYFNNTLKFFLIFYI